MKICFIGPFPAPINGCSIANDILKKHLKMDNSIKTYYIDTSSNIIEAENLGSFSVVKIVKFLKNYLKLLYIKKVDIVYTTPGQTFYGILKYLPFYAFCVFFKKPYIIHIHGNHLSNEYNSLIGFKKWIFGYFIKKASVGIVLSKSLKKNFKELLPIDRVYVVENFANNDLTQAKFQSKPKDHLRLLYLSNLMKEKGIYDFLDSLIILKDNGIKFTANIAGSIEKESEILLKKRLHELNDYVTYHGVVIGEYKQKLFMQSNVFILPTYYKMEGQPIALIEAMATGNIIMTTYFSGTPDIISEQNGYFIEAKNPQSIYERLVHINNNLAEQIEKFSFSNTLYVKENFTEEHFANKIIKIIKKYSL